MKKSKKIKIVIIAILVLFIIVLLICSKNKNKLVIPQQHISNMSEQTNTKTQGFIIYADELLENTMEEKAMNQNTKYLQSLIDKVSSVGGGIVHIPAGTYYFATGGINTRNIEYYVIKCKNNVTIEGEGTNESNGTILKPYGKLNLPLDMFYYNELRDTNGQNTAYLENADFRNFIIDGQKAIGSTYNTAGKGFMINLYKNCDWNNVVVKNTDATGFGMDNPINCTITNCIAIGCGKAGNSESAGASGFGIGTGYSQEESIYISNCIAIGNRKYGFFFEHQGRFNDLYKAKIAKGFVVSNCEASGNMYNFGGERSNDVTYENCTSYEYRSTDENSLNITNVAAFHFGTSSRRTHIINCEVNQKFTDVTDTSKPYYEAVYWALNNGITAGQSTKTEFVPNKICTRADALELLWRMAERPGEVVVTRTNTEETGYSDVAIDAYYADSVRWAKKEGIISSSSYTETIFSPKENCTRGAFLVMLWKYAGSPIVETKNSFSDVASGKWYENAVNWALEKGIISNTSNGLFLPDGTYTRAEIITLLYRFSKAKNQFSITYNLNGGKLETENRISYESGKDTFTLHNPTKQGYTFIGWTGSNGNGKQSTLEKTVTITTEDTGNKTYIANWKQNSYTISFNANRWNR